MSLFLSAHMLATVNRGADSKPALLPSTLPPNSAIIGHAIKGYTLSLYICLPKTVPNSYLLSENFVKSLVTKTVESVSLYA